MAPDVAPGREAKTYMHPKHILAKRCPLLCTPGYLSRRILAWGLQSLAYLLQLCEVLFPRLVETLLCYAVLDSRLSESLHFSLREPAKLLQI